MTFPDGRPLVLFVVNRDVFFLSHRLPIARAVRRSGIRVAVATANTGSAHAIVAEDFDVFEVPLSPQGMNPLSELQAVRALVGLYRRLRPDLVHHVGLRAVLYGSLAARAIPTAAVVNAITGLGYAFGASRRARWIRPVLEAIARLGLARERSVTIFQNPEDRRDFLRMGLVSEDRSVVILGSGVDCSLFEPRPEPEGDPLVLLASRMLWDKGVEEFVKAASALRERGYAARFALVGKPDPHNPNCVPETQLREWADAGLVEWRGYRDDMPNVFAQASVVVLPTRYMEGLPKVLLEAAASGRPIVATDVRGCREVVTHGVNGFLIPPGDTEALIRAIEALLESPALRVRFGQASRKLAVARFSEAAIVRETLRVYRSVLGPRWPSGDVERLKPQDG